MQNAQKYCIIIKRFVENEPIGKEKLKKEFKFAKNTMLLSQGRKKGGQPMANFDTKQILCKRCYLKPVRFDKIYYSITVMYKVSPYSSTYTAYCGKITNKNGMVFTPYRPCYFDQIMSFSCKPQKYIRHYPSDTI